ncbi:MAG TPA: ferritin-like domain-containing protein [Clostridia bacterium]|jgi:bacterioferritin (cytochrome b1)|nr:ferritin-like domain-containing protein [Clostridia bacterium]
MNQGYPPYDYLLANKLKQYIQEELTASAHYAELAKLAPNRRARMILQEFGIQEKKHAHNFMQAYYLLTGTIYQALPIPVPYLTDYKEALIEKIRKEIKAYKIYGEQYLLATQPSLKNLFFMTKSDEAFQATTIPLLLEKN